MHTYRLVLLLLIFIDILALLIVNREGLLKLTELVLLHRRLTNSPVHNVNIQISDLGFKENAFQLVNCYIYTRDSCLYE